MITAIPLPPIGRSIGDDAPPVSRGAPRETGGSAKLGKIQTALLGSFHPASTVLVELLRSVADRRGATPAQVALAWLLAQRPWIVPIPGTTKPHRLRENLGATEVDLTEADLSEIESRAAQLDLQGERLPEAALRMTGL